MLLEVLVSLEAQQPHIEEKRGTFASLEENTIGMLVDFTFRPPPAVAVWWKPFREKAA